MKYTDNALNVITTKSYKGIGRAWIVKYLKGDESVDSIVYLLNNYSKQEEEITVDHFVFNKNKLLNQINLHGDSFDGVVAIGDVDFPKYRGNVKDGDRPIFIFYKGDLSLLGINNNNIAVIGLLTPDEIIENREQKIVSEIVRKNITIVSGLALGCDAVAHKQALIGGKTIAILPSPISHIMPAQNRGLANEIVGMGGLLVTEYYETHKSGMELSSRYKERDRLQALFSDAIVLVASYSQDSAQRWGMVGKKLDSGARLAMEFAKEYNIPRAVMYDMTTDANNPMFDLNRQLIAEQKNISVLTQKTLGEMIDKLKSSRNDKNSIQTNLFD